MIMLRTIWLLFLLLAIGCTEGENSVNLPECTKTDCDCSDFSTQEEAQKVLNAFEGDPHKLDGDGNGLACESKSTATKTNSTKTSNKQSQKTSTNINLKFGNPSGANNNDTNNYLIEKPQYVLSYNCSTGTSNWASWQLNRSWLGSVDRSEDFRPDSDIPNGCYGVRPNDYRGSGYDRGHLASSGDRTKTQQDNSATFLMSNMIPQSPANNRQLWNDLEQYSRELVREGKELYIVAGGAGNKGNISGKVTIPKSTWKVILILDRPGAAVTKNTRTIAVNIPNNESVAGKDWRYYQVSVDVIEAATGYDFFSNVPFAVQNEIENKVE
jgi:endonuclease G